MQNKPSTLKLTFTLSCAFLCWCLTGIGQTFAPVGATWHYTETHFASLDLTYIKLECTSDTLIRGKTCSQIEAPFSCNLSGRIACYQSNDSVFIYQPSLDSFQLLYAFNAPTGSTWSLWFDHGSRPKPDTADIHIDSTWSTLINGHSLGVQSITYTMKYRGVSQSYTSKIVETIGDLHYLFNLYSVQWPCDGSYAAGLRCYEDTTIGFYETGVADSCTYVYDYNIGIEDVNDATLSVYPMPFQNQFTISSVGRPIKSIRVFDITGAEVFRARYAEQAEVYLTLDNVPSGLLILEVNRNGLTTYQKVLKKD